MHQNNAAKQNDNVGPVCIALHGQNGTAYITYLQTQKKHDSGGCIILLL